MEKKPKHHKQKKDFKRLAANKSEGRLSGPSPSHANLSSKINDETEELNSDLTEPVSTANTKTYSKRQLVTNWSKYEAILPTDDAAYSSKAADFQSLLHAPMSEGGHFKFKSESAWESYSPSQYSNIFSLDLHNLAEAISCVPFYEQLNLSKELFGEDELKYMNEEANENTERYNLSVKERTASACKVPVFSTITTGNKPTPAMTSSSKTRDIQENVNFSEALGLPVTENQIVNKGVDLSPSTEPQHVIAEEDDDLDKLLALKEPLRATQPVDLSLQPSQRLSSLSLDDHPDSVAVNTPTTPITAVEKSDNLEDWLDSMLDD